MKANAKVFNQNGVETREVVVSQEKQVSLHINGLRFIRIFARPNDLKELAVGFMLSEGLANYPEINRVDVKGSNIMVELKDRRDMEFILELRSSGCSGVIQEGLEPVESSISFERKTILSCLTNLDDASLEFKKTGGAHSAFLISKKGEALKFFEDIGRHNALDKVVGWSFLNKVSLGDKFLLFSGRLSTGIVNKAARVGIPMIVSKAAPLSGGIIAARKLNLTLIGFARHPEFNVYTHEWRIV